jgi:hypothetical protein
MTREGDMKRFLQCALVPALTILLTVSFAYAGRDFELKSAGTTLEILSEQVFEQKFAHLRELPRTDAEVIALAQSLYAPEQIYLSADVDHPAGSGRVLKAICGTPALQLLFVALQNPSLSPHTRQYVDEIMAAAYPTAWEEPEVFKISPHFRFKWAEHDPKPQHNTTRANVIETAKVLNKCWKVYSGRFRQPLCNPNKKPTDPQNKIIDVLVYSIPHERNEPEVLGRTTAFSKRIELNSQLTVNDACYRMSAPAHELFHRVEFAYGMVGVPWMLEGMAVWAEKTIFNRNKIYMRDMNRGLREPNKDLLQERDYDAAHFWVHLQERAVAYTSHTYEIVKDVLDAYKKGLDMEGNKSVNRVVRKRLNLTFDQFVNEWHKTNYVKDLEGISRQFDYKDDEVAPGAFCGSTNVPLAHVPAQNATITQNDVLVDVPPVTVKSYGAQYHNFKFDPKVNGPIEIVFDGDPIGNFAINIIGIKNNRIVLEAEQYARQYTFAHDLQPGELDKLAVLVVGLSIPNQQGEAGFRLHYTRQDTVVNFPDALLEKAVRYAISKPIGPIFASELALVTGLYANGYGDDVVVNLSGIEYCVNLEALQLYNNRIQSLQPLGGLTKLKQLELQNTPLQGLLGPLANLTQLETLDLVRTGVVDIFPLTELTQLKKLYLSYNGIHDLSPLAGLISLEELFVDANPLSNSVGIDPLAGLGSLKTLYADMCNLYTLPPSMNALTQLEHLALDHNSLVNIEPLSALSNISYLNLQNNGIVNIQALASLQKPYNLYLQFNQIQDMAPLVASGLAQGNYLYIFHNLINNNCTPPDDTTQCDHVKTLRARGVTVEWDGI